ncbi:MAG: hypothetical protein LR001_06495 [Clostridiales bacterium]|nr:hypothetical protein [Clostridiales bacterium]
MFNYWVAIAFLGLLLVPIGWFLLTLVSLIAADVNKKKRPLSEQSKNANVKTASRIFKVVK